MQLALFASSAILICVVSCAEGGPSGQDSQVREKLNALKPKDQKLEGVKQIPPVFVVTDFTPLLNKIWYTDSSLWECARDTTLRDDDDKPHTYRFSTKCVWHPRKSAQQCWGYYRKNNPNNVLSLACQKRRPNHIPDPEYKKHPKDYEWVLLEETVPTSGGGTKVEYYKE